MAFGKKPVGEKPKRRRRSPEMVVTGEVLGPPIEENLFDAIAVQHRSLQAELEQMEREVPEVGAAARAYDETVREILTRDDPRIRERVPMQRRADVVELGPDHAVWWGGVSVGEMGMPKNGAIVRLRPPAAPRVDPETVRARFVADGCAVRVAPAELADAVVAANRKIAIGLKSKRDVVLELVWQSVGDDEQRRELERYCSEVAGRVGL